MQVLEGRLVSETKPIDSMYRTGEGFRCPLLHTDGSALGLVVLNLVWGRAVAVLKNPPPPLHPLVKDSP